MRRSVVVLLLLASPALAQKAPPADGPITCSSPIAAHDSVDSLKRRYGNDAVIQDGLYTGVEDITYTGMVLLPQVPDWRIEVSFTDDTMSRVSALTLINSETSHWNVAGVTLGLSLAEVQKVNGKPYLIREFLTDGGGFVVDWKGGVLDRPLEGGCRIVVRFGRGRDMGAPRGDPISSNNAKLLKWGPVVEQIELRFPDR